MIGCLGEFSPLGSGGDTPESAPMSNVYSGMCKLSHKYFIGVVFLLFFILLFLHDLDRICG
jgi:hypothetical protein